VIQMISYSSENELRDILIANCETHLGFKFIYKEYSVDGFRIDIIGEDEDFIYVVELKREVADLRTLSQINNYISAYRHYSKKPVIGVIVALAFQAELKLSAPPEVIMKELVGFQYVPKEKHLYVKPILLKILKERDMTQNELANISGVPQSAISRFDVSESHDFSNVFAIAGSLGLNIEDLFLINEDKILEVSEQKG
jgi:DNA-binding Xre family transcriptional regulator